MPKVKPHKGLKKRVRVSAKKKVRRNMSFSGHLMSKKSGDRRRRLRKKVMLVGEFNTAALRALGEA